MTSIDKLKVAHALCVNLVEDTSMNDPRMAVLVGVRDGIADVVTELEFDDQPKGL